TRAGVPLHTFASAASRLDSWASPEGSTARCLRYHSYGGSNRRSSRHDGKPRYSGNRVCRRGICATIGSRIHVPWFARGSERAPSRHNRSTHVDTARQHVWAAAPPVPAAVVALAPNSARPGYEVLDAG